MRFLFNKRGCSATRQPACLALAVGLSLSASIQAQETAANEREMQLEEVVVTGSRIVRNDLTANSPIAIFDQEDLQLQNTTNLEEYLRDMPQFVAGIGANGNNGNDGGATVDLRNLGEERTLVLVDGKRFIPYDYDGYVDIGMIPTALVERVEVITGGASAVYGSDAVAGVVNFIMKKDFEGVELDSSYGMTERGDGNRLDLNLTLGGDIAGGRGNVVLNVGYTDQRAVTQGDRSFSLFSLDDLLEPGGSLTTPWGSLLGNYPGADLDGDGVVQFDPSGSGNIVDTTNLFNFNPFNLLQVPQTKWTGTTIASYDVTDDVSVYARGSFANNRIATIIAPTGTFFFPFVLNTNNPFLSSQAQQVFIDADNAETNPATAGDGFVDISLGRRLNELGTRDSLYENTAYQVVAGATGTLADNYRWELFAQDGRTTRAQNFRNDANYNAALQAILAVQNPDGSVSCMDPSGGCAPANFFGEGQLSPEAANFIRLNLNENNKTTQFVYGGSITGDTPLSVPMAANPMAFAFGFEIRKDTAQNLPDQNYATGNTIGFGSSTPVDAEIEINEVFGELSLPIVDNSAVGSIALEAGVRYADYKNSVIGGPNNSFNNTSWKVGGEWSIVDAVRLRGGYQKAVRAPTIAEIGLPRTPSTGDLSTDPCEGSNPVGNAALTALCIATGVPAANIGSVTSIIAGQIGNFLGGNPSLRPEEADTYTFGVVFTPESWPMNIAVDYYRIEITDAITQISEQNVINVCYQSEMDPNAPFCSRIARSPLNGSLNGGTETGVDVSLINAASEETSGIDITLEWDVDLDRLGSLDLDLRASTVLDNKQRQAAFFREDDCVGLVGNTCVRPNPEWRWVQNTRWIRGPLMLNLRWQYLSSLTNDAIVLDGVSPAEFATPKIGSYSYFDLSGNYELSDTMTLRAGIYNLLDKEPPIVGNDYGGTLENSGNTYPATYDPLGRAYSLGLNVKF